MSAQSTSRFTPITRWHRVHGAFSTLSFVPTSSACIPHGTNPEIGTAASAVEVIATLSGTAKTNTNPSVNIIRFHEKNTCIKKENQWIVLRKMSERRESDPRIQLGRLSYYHCTTLAKKIPEIIFKFYNPVNGSIRIADSSMCNSSVSIFFIAVLNPVVPTI